METANLFNQNPQGQFNASVGENGWTDINTYIQGYRSATIVMLESIINMDINRRLSVVLWHNNTAVYPICFSARHYIELYLKQKIFAINFLKVKKENAELIENKLMRTHDIKKLWDLFIDIVQQTNDSRIDEFISKIEPYVNDFAQIDLTGETFRYPYNANYSEKHLTNQAIINLENFYNKFKKLSDLFEYFTIVMDDLVDEYKTGTYTKKLSRANIQTIAEQLPIYSKWGSNDFKDLKEKIKNRFCIGSKELSDAINIIKNHIEFKRNIYPNNYELPIDKDKLVKLIQGEFTEQDFHLFTSAEIACLMALIELGSKPMGLTYYAENFAQLSDKFLKENENIDLREDYKYILETIHSNRLKDGLKIIGYSDVLSQENIDEHEKMGQSR